MRILQKILNAFCLVVLFLTATVILFQRSPWFWLENMGNQIVEWLPVLAQNALLVAALLSVLALAGIAWRRFRGEVLITRETDDGSVTIVESAIKRYMKQAAADLDSVLSVRTEIHNARDGMVIDVYAKVRVTESLTQIERAIRSRMRQALEETLGLGSVATINVIVEEFELVGSKPGAQAAAATEPAVKVPVTVPLEETEALADSETTEAATPMGWSGFPKHETEPPEETASEETVAQPPEDEPETISVTAETLPDVDEAETEPAAETEEADVEDVEDKSGAETPESDTTEKRD